MKKFIVYVISFLVISVFYFDNKAQGSTIIPGGDVSGEWAMGGSPYMVQGNITVTTGEQLIIRPGVEVIFQRSYFFEVLGSLQATGTVNDTIYFKAQNPSVKWWGILFDTEDFQDPSQSAIKFCRFENVMDRPGNERFGAIKIKQHTLGSIENCTFMDCELAISLSAQSPLNLIKNCYFNNISGQWAVNMTTNQLITTLDILDNKFFNIQQNAIIVEDNSAMLHNINIENNKFINASTALSKSSILVNENDLIENVSILLNTFENFNHGYPDLSTISFYDNNDDFNIIFTGNKVENCGYKGTAGVGAYTGGINVDKSNKIYFRDNEFSGNQGYKAGAAYLNANRFSSAGDVYHNNLSFFKANVESGNGGSIFFQSMNQDGVFRLTDDQFSQNSAERYGGSVYLKIVSTFDSIELKNSSFTGEYAELSGGSLAVLFENDINFTGLYNNTFAQNKAEENGGSIWLYAEEAYDIGKFESDNNEVTGDDAIIKTETYIYYSALALPGSMRFSNDIISDIDFDNSYAAGNRVIHFEDRSPQPDDNISTVNIMNSAYSNCNRGIFYFSARHEIDEILLHKSIFNGISTDSTGGIFVKSNSIGEIRIEAGTYSSIINSNSDGGVMYFSSALDIDHLRVLSYDNMPSDFSTCISEGSGGCLYARAGRLIGDVKIQGTYIRDSHASGNGGNFYFESGLTGNLVQTLTVSENDVTGLPGANQGSGGFLYYSSPSSLSILDITSNLMGSINALGRGGAFYISADDVGPVILRANNFAYIRAESDGNVPADGGLIYLYSAHNIESIDILPGEDLVTNRFIDSYSDDNGGCMYAKASGLIGPVLVDSALFSNSHSGMKGGSLYMQSGTAKSSRAQSLLFVNNTITGNSTQNSSDLEGGFLYYFSPSSIESVSFTSNTIEYLTAGGAAGAFYIDANGIGPVQVESNVMQNIQASGKGGGFFVTADDIGTVTIQANEFTQVTTQGNTVTDGGVMYLNSSDDIEGIFIIASLTGDSNIFNGCHSSGSGGCLFANAGGSIGDIKVENTHITNCFADENGGSFCLKSEDPAASQGLNIFDNMVFGNSSQTLTGGDGGFLYYQSSAYLDSFEIRANTLEDIYSSGNGGSMYVSIADISALEMEGNTFLDSRSVNANGGVLYLKSNKDIASMKITSTPAGDTNLFNNCFAGLNGGCVFAHAVGLIGNVNVSGTKFTGCFAGTGGGSLYLKSENSNSDLSQQILIMNSNEITGSPQSITGGPGGFAFCSTPSYVSQLDFSENMAKDLRVNGAGGCLYLAADKTGAADIQDNRFSNFTCANPAEDAEGGAIYIHSDVLPVAHLLFDSNDLENIHGFSNGGALNISGKGLQIGIVSNNTWENITSGNYGGMAYFNNSTRTGTLNVEDNTFENSQSFSDIPVNGGAIFISGLDTVICAGSEFKDLISSDKGGGVSIENTLNADFNQCIFNICESGATGGAVNIAGNSEIETLSVRGCSFYHNTADQKGGGLFVSQIDNVMLGEVNNGNIFSANQNLIGDDCMGGAVYANQISSFKISASRFFGNSSMDGGGIYLGETGEIDCNANVFLGNIAFSDAENIGGNGGAMRLLNVHSGDIRFSGFQTCSSDNHGGALDIYNTNPSNNDTLFLTDNYFYLNYSREGGAILSNYSLNLKRNLFNENECRNLQPPADYVGSALSLYNKGVQSVFYNCVFDYNLSTNAEDGSIYFRQESLPIPYTYSIQNCTFLNGGNNKSIYSENDIQIVNSLFINYFKADFEPEYFNENVTAFYSDLVGAGITDNHNFDSTVTFSPPNCYSVSCDQPVVDMGDPAPYFFDNHMPPGCDEPLNDVGVTGGPNNPDMSSIILCELNDTLSVKVTAIQDCDTYTFTCTENVELWDNYFWYLPNNEVLVNNTNQVTIQLDLPPGQIFIRLLVEDTNQVPSQFAFGIDSLIVKELRIDSLGVTNAVPSGDYYNVNEIPFTFQIAASLLDKPEEYDYSWVITETSGVTIDTSYNETTITVTILTIDPAVNELYFNVLYTGKDLHCNFEVEESLRVNIHTTCMDPMVTFIPYGPDGGEIMVCNDSLIIHFSQPVIHKTLDTINESNIESIYELTIDGIQYSAKSYNIFDIDPTGIIFYLDPDVVCNKVGSILELKLLGDNVVTEDCKISCTGGPSNSIPITVGISEISTGFEIYPNPTKDKVCIYTGAVSSYDISVYSVMGGKVMTREGVNSDKYELSFHTLPRGIYFIHLVDRRNQQTTSFRIIKE